MHVFGQWSRSTLSLIAANHYEETLQTTMRKNKIHGVELYKSLLIKVTYIIFTMYYLFLIVQILKGQHRHREIITDLGHSMLQNQKAHCSQTNVFPPSPLQVAFIGMPVAELLFAKWNEVVVWEAQRLFCSAGKTKPISGGCNTEEKELRKGSLCWGTMTGAHSPSTMFHSMQGEESRYM